jgi:hypothetical protein
MRHAHLAICALELNRLTCHVTFFFLGAAAAS